MADLLKGGVLDDVLKALRRGLPGRSMTLAELVEKTGRPAGSVSQAVGQLEARGLVATDRAVRPLRVTAVPATAARDSPTPEQITLLVRETITRLEAGAAFARNHAAALDEAVRVLRVHARGNAGPVMAGDGDGI